MNTNEMIINAAIAVAERRYLNSPWVEDRMQDAALSALEAIEDYDGRGDLFTLANYALGMAAGVTRGLASEESAQDEFIAALSDVVGDEFDVEDLMERTLTSVSDGFYVDGQFMSIEEMAAHLQDQTGIGFIEAYTAVIEFLDNHTDPVFFKTDEEEDESFCPLTKASIGRIINDQPCWEGEKLVGLVPQDRAFNWSDDGFTAESGPEGMSLDDAIEETKAVEGRGDPIYWCETANPEMEAGRILARHSIEITNRLVVPGGIVMNEIPPAKFQISPAEKLFSEATEEEEVVDIVETVSFTGMIPNEVFIRLDELGINEMSRREVETAIVHRICQQTSYDLYDWLVHQMGIEEYEKHYSPVVPEFSDEELRESIRKAVNDGSMFPSEAVTLLAKLSGIDNHSAKLMGDRVFRVSKANKEELGQKAVSHVTELLWAKRLFPEMLGELPEKLLALVGTDFDLEYIEYMTSQHSFSIVGCTEEAKEVAQSLGMEYIEMPVAKHRYGQAWAETQAISVADHSIVRGKTACNKGFLMSKTRRFNISASVK